MQLNAAPQINNSDQTTSQNTEEQWFFTSGSKRYGPVKIDKLPLGDDVLIQKYGMDDQKKRSEISELKNVLTGIQFEPEKEYQYQCKSTNTNINSENQTSSSEQTQIQNKGPIDKQELLNLYSSGSGDIDLSTLVQTEGMKDWTPISNVTELVNIGIKNGDNIPTNSILNNQSLSTSNAIISGQQKTTLILNNQKQNDVDVASDKVQHYADNYRNQKGPVSLEEMKQLQKNAEIQKLTLCQRKGLENWKPVSEIDELSILLQLSSDKNEINKDKETDEEILELFGVKPSDTEIGNKRSLDSDNDIDNSESIGNTSSSTKHHQKKKKKKWKNIKKHAHIFVTGLPLDITIEEMTDYFKKCGIIKKDMLTGEPRVKIYSNEDGSLKGEGRVSYLKEESVQLAIEMLDDSEIRPGVKIHVEKATFQMKGDVYIPKNPLQSQNNGDSGNNGSKNTSKVSKYTARMIARSYDQSKELDQAEDDDEEMLQSRTGLRIVILKPMFDIQEVKNESDHDKYYDELEHEIGMECQRVGGSIEKITVFRGSPSGAVAIKFETPSGAEKCIATMNGRYFAGKTISCEYFDGTDYRVKETEEDEEQRLEDFGKQLENGEEDKQEKDDNVESVEASKIQANDSLKHNINDDTNTKNDLKNE